MNVQLDINLTAAICLLENQNPVVVTYCESKDAKAQLPSGNFNPQLHKTFAQGLRDWVSVQTQMDLGYVEQLYTFGDRGRHAQPEDLSPHVVSVGYLALTKKIKSDNSMVYFSNWYDFFPWEDWRSARPPILDEKMIPNIKTWVEQNPTDITSDGLTREEKANLYFGLKGKHWDEEKVLERYEMLYSAGMVEEAYADGRPSQTHQFFGKPMAHDHRRILATAIGRLRSKLKYRPLIFELISDEFTLTTLQKTVEAISGKHVHTQNFRRFLENTALVEPTGKTLSETGGRPAALYQFRREVLSERPSVGLRLGTRL